MNNFLSIHELKFGEEKSRLLYTVFHSVDCQQGIQPMLCVAVVKLLIYCDHPDGPLQH